MILSITVKDAHGIHITYGITKIDNEIEPTLKKLTLKMSSTLA